MKLKDMCCVLIWMLLPLFHSCNIFLFPICCRKSIWVCWAGDAPVGLSTEEVCGHGDPLCREGNQTTCWNLLASTAKLYSSFLSSRGQESVFLGGHTCKAVYHCPQNRHRHSTSKWSCTDLIFSDLSVWQLLLLLLCAGPGEFTLTKKIQKCSCRTCSFTILMCS